MNSRFCCPDRMAGSGRPIIGPIAMYNRGKVNIRDNMSLLNDVYKMRKKLADVLKEYLAYKFYENLFGGLDKMYLAHRYLGTLSLALLLIHPVSLSLLRLDDSFKEAVSVWFKVSDFAIWIGGVAFYLMLNASVFRHQTGTLSFCDNRKI